MRSSGAPGLAMSVSCSERDEHPPLTHEPSYSQENYLSPSAERKESTEKEPEDFTYTALLDRSAGKKMGVAVKLNQETRSLQVMKVEEEGSAVGVWNVDHPENMVCSGDHMDHVNGIRDIAELVDECMKMKLLRIGFRRKPGAL